MLFCLWLFEIQVGHQLITFSLMLAGVYEKYEEEKRKAVRMDRSRVCNSVNCEQ